MNRESFSVPNCRLTYTSVQPASGESGPSSRNIFSASFNDAGRRKLSDEIAVRMDRRD